MLPIGSTLVAEKPIYNFLKERYIKILPILEFFSQVLEMYIGGICRLTTWFLISKQHEILAIILLPNTSRYSVRESSVLLIHGAAIIHTDEVNWVYIHTTPIFNTD